MSVHEYARRTNARHARQLDVSRRGATMSADQLVYRLVSVAIDGPRPHDALCDLAGVLYDAASHAFDSVEKYRTSHPELAHEFRVNRAQMVDLAGYVLRVAGTFDERVA